MLKIDKNQKGSGIIIKEVVKDYGAPLDLIVGVDAGSTQTRVCIADRNDAHSLLDFEQAKRTYDFLRDCVYIIPSTYAVVSDEREILPKTDNLEDNYDSRLIRVRSSAVRPMIGSDRIVRGRKIKDSAGLVPRYLDSATNKVDNPIYYANVLDGIGYAIMQKYNGAIPNKVKIHLALSVRPKEQVGPCVEKMNENFLGEYIFRWKGLAINMVVCDTLYTTEPEAQITGTNTTVDLAALVCDDERDRERAQALSDKFGNSGHYIHIEGGGSSIGVEVIEDDQPVTACSQTFPLGGNYLVRVVMDRLRETKGRNVSEESVRSAIQTCLLKNGRESEDISALISACKNSVAYDILERLRHNVIDVTTDMSLRDMDFITLGGRLFSEDVSGGSIGKYFANYVSQISPNTEVIILNENYIPQGNLILGLNEFEVFGDIVQKYAEEEE